MLVLVIMDGWGYQESVQGNVIRDANTPFFNTLDREAPKTLLKASGLDVGLPEGQMGNSEVGHLNIGSGRILFQELPRISNAIKEGTFFENQALKGAFDRAKHTGSPLHLIGLLSDGGVHSHMEHLFALMDMAKRNNIEKLFFHLCMDGRDTEPRSAAKYIKQLQAKIAELGVGKIATIMGRYYGMDRDNRWERVHEAYNAMVDGMGESDKSPLNALKKSYTKGVNDEFVKPTVIVGQDGKPTATLNKGDSIIFYNFRADRVRQIISSMSDVDFQGFVRGGGVPDFHITCLTQYHERFNFPVAFSPDNPVKTLGEVVSNKGKMQFRTAETEKYAHVTFFFNGGREKPYKGEDRILIASPKVATYDLMPEMSAAGVTDTVLEAIDTGKYELIVVNFANPDMVGHTGVYSAAIKAIETIDSSVRKVSEAVRRREGTVLITADHGNVEAMIDENGGPITAHTTNRVPFYCLSTGVKKLKQDGRLADIAPTILKLMSIEQPPEMTGESLIEA